jgi:hypothetical protein
LIHFPQCWCGKIAKRVAEDIIECAVHGRVLAPGGKSQKPYPTRRRVYRYLWDAKYHKEHREERNLYNRQYYIAHREKLIRSAVERNKLRKARNPDKFAEDSRKSTTKGRDKLRRQLLQVLGGKCARCGFEDFRALQVDHINGGGRQEIVSFGNQMYRYYKHILAEIEQGNRGKYQILCANCNLIKAWESRRGQA